MKWEKAPGNGKGHWLSSFLILNGCFVWKGFPTFRSHLRMRPVSRRHSRRGLVGASTLRSTPISRSPLEKNPMPGHLSELHPVNEVNTKGQ